MASPPRHVFVCVNDRPVGSRPACAHRGSREVLEALTGAVAKVPALWGEVRITGCQCLGSCWSGPNLVVYPEGTRYAGVSSSDVDEIVQEHLVQGRPVQRLLDSADDPYDLGDD